MSTAEQARADVDELFNLLASNPQGMYLSEMSTATGWHKARVRRTIRRLRLVFNKDAQNLICEPLVYRGEWVYRFVGDFKDAQFWINNRERDMMSRLVTVKSIAESIKLGTDRGTVAGKKARLTVKIVGRLIEDLAEVVV